MGNRLTQDTHLGSTSYTYDIANRLTAVGATTYTWDDNGNLLSDGASTYAYDAANRLASVTQGSNNYTFTYNGQGDRVRQTVNGVPTYYVLDLNAGQTQVLADGTNTYLYGNGRIAQQSAASTDYFLGDALGSVRQLTDATGVVTLARNYEPFGSDLSSAGSAASAFGFTGEQQQGGLVYLRARYYSSDFGRFVMQDAWLGSYIKLAPTSGGYGSETSRFSTEEWPDYTRPLSLNGWAYAEGNPINHTDPSGHYACRFATNRDRWFYKEQNWSHCSELTDTVFRHLSSDPAGKPVSYALWRAFQRYTSMLTVEYYGTGDLHGGWGSGGPIIQITSHGVPWADNLKGTTLAPNDAVYVSAIAHEMAHIALQTAAQNTDWGETDAYAVQMAVLEELGGTKSQVAAVRDIGLSYALTIQNLGLGPIIGVTFLRRPCVFFDRARVFVPAFVNVFIDK